MYSSCVDIGLLSGFVSLVQPKTNVLLSFPCGLYFNQEHRTHKFLASLFSSYSQNTINTQQTIQFHVWWLKLPKASYSSKEQVELISSMWLIVQLILYAARIQGKNCTVLNILRESEVRLYHKINCLHNVLLKTLASLLTWCISTNWTCTK